jgi:hypothetical protein
MSTLYDKLRERVFRLSWTNLAALLLASVERLLAYRRAYLRRVTLPPDAEGEPDLERALDRGWESIRGATVPSRMPVDLGVEPEDLWGALANQQIKAHAIDCAEAVADKASIGHLRTLLRAVLDTFAAIEEFEADGFVRGPAGWRGVEAEEREALERDLAWLENLGPETVANLREHWRNTGGGVTLTDG